MSLAKAQWGAGYRPHPTTRGLRLALDGTPVRASRISAHDAELIVPSLPMAVNSILQVELGPHSVSYPVTLTDVVKEEGGETRATVRSVISDRDTLRPLLALFAELRHGNLVTPPLEQEAAFDEVSGPRERIESLLRALGTLHDDVRVRAIGAPSHPWPIDGRLPDDEDAWPRQRFDVDIRTPMMDYCFQVGPQRQGPRDIAVVRLNARDEARVAAPHRLEVLAAHPLLAGEVVALPVQYVSRKRLICRVDPDRDLLYPGLLLPKSELRWVGGQMSAMLLVRDIESDSQGSRAIIEVFPEMMDASWTGEVDALCHPNTFLDASDVDAVWELYSQSGYFDISGKGTRAFGPLYEDFVDASERIAAHPEVGSQIKWRSGASVDGTVTFLRAFDRSAIQFQLARTRKRAMCLSGHRALYDMYRRAVEHGLRHGVEWHMVYVQKEGARFSRLINHEFPARFASDPRQACVVSFRPWEMPTERIAPPSTEVVVEEPTSGVLDGWLTSLADRRPAAYLESLDLVPSRAHSPATSKRFAEAGLMRRRAYRIARVGGRPMAMATLDVVSDGVHLFGLLDACRIDVWHSGELLRWALVAALLEDARDFYASAGKAKFVYFDESHGAAPVSDATSLGDADMACFSATLSARWIEEVALATGGRG